VVQDIRITYATLSEAGDDEQLQSAFDEAVARVRREWLGADVPMFIDGEAVYADETFDSSSPFDTDLHLCTAQKGGVDHARAAVGAAAEAFPTWSRVPWQDRVGIVRGIAERISEQSLDLAALMVFEVGKSWLEALAEVGETVALLRYYADAMERNDGFTQEMGKLDPDDPDEYNVSVLRPYGVWVVISPFNFPLALSAAPIAAALLTGNTVVFKAGSDTPYDGWKTAQLFADAPLPDGVFNYISGRGSVVGQELQDNPGVDGWTFTGSHDVGMTILKQAVSGPYPRPAIVEMGGKNPAIVSDTADLERAALGVMRAAFGLTGQKCSACSRVYVQEGVYRAFRERLMQMTRDLRIGDPTDRDTFTGPLINQRAYEKFKRYVAMARADADVLVGGDVLAGDKFARGYFVEPTIVEGLPEDHTLVREELFVPILHLARVTTLDEAMGKANDTKYGLTAGFYGEDGEEIASFFEHIQAGTTYANRAGGATTGAWPGVQPFGGWKGSGSTGKNIGGLYSLPLYMREQSQTIIG
jgi:1-pyrroline-5-carboxylate dehydrogenase